MTKRITLALLQAKGACQAEMDVFQELYPDGVIPTPDECEKAQFRLSLFWAAENLLNKKQRAKYRTRLNRAARDYHNATADFYAQRELAYAPLSDALHAVKMPAITERNRKLDELGLEDIPFDETNRIWAEYLAAVDPATEAFEEQAVLIEAAHQEAIGPATDAYQTAKARAFGEVWCS